MTSGPVAGAAETKPKLGASLAGVMLAARMAAAIARLRFSCGNLRSNTESMMSTPLPVFRLPLNRSKNIRCQTREIDP